jgi:hypothetical protein
MLSPYATTSTKKGTVKGTMNKYDALKGIKMKKAFKARRFKLSPCIRSINIWLIDWAYGKMGKMEDYKIIVIIERCRK